MKNICLHKSAKIQCHDTILGDILDYCTFMNDIKVSCIQIFPSPKKQHERERKGGGKVRTRTDNFQNEEWKSKYILWLTAVKLAFR